MNLRQKDTWIGFGFGAVIATGVTFLVTNIHFHQEEQRLSNMRPHLDEQKGSVMIVIGYTEEVPIMRLFSVNTPMDESRVLDDKQEGHGYTFHDKELAQEAVKAANKAVSEVAVKQMKAKQKK